MRFEPTRRLDAGGAPATRAEVLHCDGIRIGRFVCPPGAPAWAEDNRIGGGALMVIPHRAVEIRQRGAQTVHAHPGQAVYYRRGQVYRRRLEDPRGDACVWIHLGHQRWRALARAVGLGDDVDPDDPFPFQRGPLAPRHYERACALVSALLRGEITDALDLQERLLPLVERGLGEAVAAAGRRTNQRPPHAKLGDRAEALVASTFRENLSLDRLAAQLDTSPAHLARVFRQHTGRSLHQYRLSLRLAASVALLADAERTVTDIALELGFSSPSHFATTLRRTLGVAPTALRGLGASGQAALLADRAGI